ncbi:MAG TPA: hypothetical protein VFW60_10245 [Rhodanobacteraceae bacterium]|nr:hypothetical protein [Rhodanobacteraceae bacterium]
MKAARVAAAMALCVIASGALAGNPANPATASDAYLKPHVRVGERITDVYSKSFSWSGKGLKGFVWRYSGASTSTVVAVTPEAIVSDEADRTDGQAPTPPARAKVLADGNTHCYKGKCRIDRETSGTFFIPLLWGHAPARVHAGSHWTVTIDKPWEIGPRGTELVQVVSTDPAHGEIMLVRHGTGSGVTQDELRLMAQEHPIKITTSDGKKIAVTLHPGKATWSGYTTVRRGVIVGDEIMLTQQVQFVAKNGKAWNAELRVYTLLNLGGDEGSEAVLRS